MIKSIIQLLRPHQWLKNLFIFLPLFFDRQLTDLDKLLAVVGAFVAYSLAASAIYCFNDIWDVEADRHIPRSVNALLLQEKYQKGWDMVLVRYLSQCHCFYLLLIQEGKNGIYLA